MEISIETLSVLFILIPGLLSSSILDSLVPRPSRDISDRIFEAIVFSFLIYSFSGIFGNDYEIAKLIKENDKLIIVRKSYLLPLFLSVVIPLILSIIYKYDLIHSILRKYKITDNTIRKDVWLDVFQEQKRAITINFNDGKRIFGWPEYYPNSPDDGYIYLYNPAWIIDGEYLDLDLHGIMLNTKDNIQSIEFSNITADNAADCSNDIVKKGDIICLEKRVRLKRRAQLFYEKAIIRHQR